MKKILLFMLIIASITNSCSKQNSQELLLQDIKDETLYKLQNEIDSYWTIIRIDSWEDNPVDTLTKHDMYHMREHIAWINMIHATFDVVEPKVNYEWSMKYPDEFTMQQKNNFKRKYDAALKREEEAKAELNKWKGIAIDSLGVDTIAYVVYHFVSIATDIKGEDQYFDYSYCYYNCLDNKVDTVIELEDDLETFKKTTEYIDFKVELPIVQNIK